MSYIFGSFARRRQSQEVGVAKRRSIEPPVNHERSKSTPHSAKRTEKTSPRAKSVCSDESKLKCSMCRRQFVEPRVLPCLHTFCLRCIQELEANDYGDWCELQSDGSPEQLKDTNSGGSGYISDKTNTLRSCSATSARRVCCPTCGARAEVPSEGVSAFPPNYLLQQRLVLATLNAPHSHLLCDLCASEVSAVARCMDCAVSFCRHCEEAHVRQKAADGHEVLSLEEARKKGITRVRRQIMCGKHADLEINLFCSTCYQVLCRECAATTHRGHTNEPISRAIKAHLTNLRISADKAKAIAEQSALAANRLHTTSRKLEAECSRIQTEVERFIDAYVQTVEEHRQRLVHQVQETREAKLQELSQYKRTLHKKVRQARDVALFLEELLAEGSDVEVLTFVAPIINQMGKCGDGGIERIDGLTGSLQFLPEEAVQYESSACPIYGVVTTQTISPGHCVLSAGGLNNLRVGKKTDLLLLTKDRHNAKIDRGGELVFAEIRYRDAGISRFLPVDVEDRRDGSYTISFTPDVAGKLMLSISVKGQPIKDSPIPILVRTLKPHQGTFHCCSFCSSGGTKDASCGCGGKMPGGYRGCGHGHEGHPGRRHWSCCGNIMEHSECTRSNNSHYQFTL